MSGNDNSRTKKTIVNTGFGFLTRITNLIARFVLQTVLVYTLGIQYTGVSGLFTSVFTILALAELGIGSAITYALYKPLAENNEKKIAELMNFFRMAYRLIALIVFVLGILVIPFLKYIVKDVPDIKENIILIYVMYVIKTVASYLLVYKSTLLIANQENYIVSSVQSIVDIIRTVLECIALLIFKEFLYYLIIEIIANVVQNIITSYLADKKYPYIKKYKKIKMNKSEQNGILHNIKAVAMYKASRALGGGVDNIVVSTFMGTASVGLMSNYLLIKEQLMQFLNQFFNAVVPGIGNLAVTSTIEHQYKIFSELLFLSFWISSFCSISYFILIQPFITIWLGGKFLLSIAIAAVIALDFYLGSMLNIIASFRTANGLFIKGQYRPLIMTIINVILSIILGIKFGIFGVLFATVFSRLITQWYDPYLLFKIVFKKSPRNFYFEYYSYLLITVIIAIAIFTISNIFTMKNTIVILLLRAALCILIPNAVIMVLYRRTDKYKMCIGRFKKIANKIIKKIKH